MVDEEISDWMVRILLEEAMSTCQFPVPTVSLRAVVTFSTQAAHLILVLNCFILLFSIQVYWVNRR